MNEASPSLASKVRLKEKISEIKLIPYGDKFGQAVVFTEPSPTDVEKAINEKQFETRGFQGNLKELIAEWMQGSQQGQNLVAWENMVKTYHARRIAHFVVNGWDDTITVKPDGTITDGSHRVRAAIHRGMNEVDIEIEQ